MQAWPGVVLALVTLSHVVSTIVVVAATVPWLLRRRSARTVGTSWLVGFGLTAFWSVPFVVRVMQGLTTDMRWGAVTNLVGAESPVPLEIVPAVLLAVGGVAWCVVRRAEVAPLISLGVVALVGYFLLPWIGVGVLNNGRLLPYWYVTVYLFAGIAVGAGAVALGRMRTAASNGAARYALVAAALVALFSVALVRDVTHWVAWDFTGYEGKAAFGEYDALMQTIDDLPPGRIMWEENDAMYRYGTQLALMLFPYWSSEHPSMAGVYQESSLTTPFNLINASEVGFQSSRRIAGLRYSGMDFDRGIAHLALYGARYYVSFTPEAAAAARAAGLDTVADASPWVVFALPSSDLVEAGRFTPSVWNGHGGFTKASLDWYDDVERLDQWLVADGPQDWPRVDKVEERREVHLLDESAAAAAVSDVVFDAHRISFETAAVGVPHLIKMSYFPNWTAKGAEGPYRAAPSLMIVVPTEQSVVLEFSRSRVEYLGLVITFTSLVLVIAWVWRRRPGRRDEVSV